MNKPPTMNVIYRPGVTVYGSLPAQLQWTEDDRVILTTVGGTPDAPVHQQLFNVHPGEFQSVKSTLDTLKFTLNGQSVSVSVIPQASIAMRTSSIYGLIAANSAYKKSGAETWLEALRAQGVTTSRFGYGKMVGAVGAGTIAFIAIVVAIVLVTEG